MKGKMKAQVFYEAEKMKLEEVPIPEITDIDVLIKVKNVGICGSDISYYYGLSPVGTATGKGPIILGHEFTGEVVEVGKVPQEMGLYKPGDRVVVNPVQNCNACFSCAKGQTHLCQNLNVPGVSTDGGFAQYCVSRYTGLFKLPDDVSYAQGAFTEPLACAFNGLRKLKIQPGDFVAIFGPGSMGMMMTQLAKRMGAGKIVIIGAKNDDWRLEQAKKVGADFIFNIMETSSKYYTEDLGKSIKEVNSDRLADRAIVPTSSNAAFEQAVEISGNCATIVHYGLPNEDDVFEIPALSFHTMDKEIRSAWLAPLAWAQTIRIIENGLVKFDSLITGTYPLEKTEEAIRLLKTDPGQQIKIQIKVSE
ncbi:MAG: alcohol dehydrogenase catalytic domain-containing protein [Actinomycetota bacterium]|nr:alcohol dehydrogenase catalytic domain-containing protein [Actinomycetota bacterium]